MYVPWKQISGAVRSRPCGALRCGSHDGRLQWVRAMSELRYALKKSKRFQSNGGGEGSCFRTFRGNIRHGDGVVLRRRVYHIARFHHGSPSELNTTRLQGTLFPRPCRNCVFASGKHCVVLAVCRNAAKAADRSALCLSVEPLSRDRGIEAF